MVNASISATSESFSFVVFGDNRDGPHIYKDVLNLVSEEEIDFCVNTGDFVSRGSEKEYQDYIDLIEDYDLDIFHVLGNHDAVYGGRERFKRYFGKPYYSFDHKNSHFVILDNSFKRYFTAKQYNWLIEDLKKNDKLHTFVFFHRPIFDPSGFYVKNIMEDRKMSKKLQYAFQKYGVDYVIAGHIHGYAKGNRAGIDYIVTGGAGAPLYLPKNFGGFHHYVKIDVEGDRIKDKVVKIYNE